MKLNLHDFFESDIKKIDCENVYSEYPFTAKSQLYEDEFPNTKFLIEGEVLNHLKEVYKNYDMSTLEKCAYCIYYLINHTYHPDDILGKNTSLKQIIENINHYNFYDTVFKNDDKFTIRRLKYYSIDFSGKDFTDMTFFMRVDVIKHLINYYNYFNIKNIDIENFIIYYSNNLTYYLESKNQDLNIEKILHLANENIFNHFNTFYFKGGEVIVLHQPNEEEPSYSTFVKKEEQLYNNNYICLDNIGIIKDRVEECIDLLNYYNIVVTQSLIINMLLYFIEHDDLPNEKEIKIFK